MTRAVTVLLAVDEATSGLTDDDRHLAAALDRRGAHVAPLVWGRDVTTEAVVVIRSTWDYIERPMRFGDWLDRLEAANVTVHNSVALLRWNMHKRYLVELARRGVPTVAGGIMGIRRRRRWRARRRWAVGRSSPIRRVPSA